MKRLTLTATATCALLIASSTFATTVTLKHSCESKDDAFNSGTPWSDGAAPGPKKDYLVTGGYYICGDYDQTFRGDSLQLGEVGGKEGVLYKLHAGTLTFTNLLILANGYHRMWLSTEWQQAHIKCLGGCRVISPETAPFGIFPSHNAGATGWHLYWDAALSGDAGTGLKIGPHWNATKTRSIVHLTADNSAYLGSLRIYGENQTVEINSGAALGGALAAMKADALTLEDNTTLKTSGSLTLAKALNRGLTVKSSGGRLDVPAGATLTFEWPICGEGTLTKQGAGTLVLNGGLKDSAKLAVTTGTLVLAKDFAAGDDNVLTLAAGTQLAAAAGEDVVIGAVDLSATAIKVVYDDTLKTNGVLVLSSATSLTSLPIGVYPPTNRVMRMPFLKVPTKLGAISASSFKLPDDLAATGLPSATFSVETAGDVQIAYLTTAARVQVKATAVVAYYSADVDHWTDGKAMHGQADYFIDAKVQQTQFGNYGLPAATVLPGNSLNFVGYSSSCNAIFGIEKIPIKVNSFTGDIRAFDYVKFYLKPLNTEFVLGGKLYVGGTQTSDNGLDIRPTASGTYRIDSVVSGTGTICMQPNVDGITSTICFTSPDNTFAGLYMVYGASTSKTQTKTILKFANAGSFGRPPATEGRSVLMQGRNEFYPVGSQTYDFPTREFVFWETGNSIRTDENETFTLAMKLGFDANSTTEKVGAGTWAVGAPSVKVYYSGTPKLTVSEGYVRADNARAFENVAVTIGENGGIAAKYVPGSATEAATNGLVVVDAAKFAISGDSLRVKIETDGAPMAQVKVPFLTVPSSLAETVDAKTFSLTHDVEGRTGKLVRETIGASVRYSYSFHKGSILILR